MKSKYYFGTKYYLLTVLPKPSSSYGATSGSGTYKRNAEIQISASPNVGYKFLEWQEDELITNPRTITVRGDATYNAIFCQQSTDELRIVDASLNLYTYNDYNGLTTKPAAIGVAIKDGQDWLLYYKLYIGTTSDDIIGYAHGPKTSSDGLPSNVFTPSAASDLLYAHSGLSTSNLFKNLYNNSGYAAYEANQLQDGNLTWYIPNLYETCKIFGRAFDSTQGAHDSFNSHFTLANCGLITVTDPEQGVAHAHWTSDVNYGASQSSAYINPYRVFLRNNTNSLLYKTSGNYTYFHNVNFVRPVARFLASQISITYNRNEAESGTEPAGGTFYKGSLVTIATKGDLYKYGCSFNGWNTQSDGSGTSYMENLKVNLHNNVYLYADWIEGIYGVRAISTYGGSATPSSSTSTTYNTGCSITATANSGYSFVEWSIYSGDTYYRNGHFKNHGTGSPSQSANTTFYPADNSVLLATFSANNYSITLNNQLATTPGTQHVDVVYDSNQGISSNITCPTKTGYIFGGYYTWIDGGGQLIIDSDGVWQKGNTYIDSAGNWIYANNVYLYAKWTVVYSVTYNANGATGGSVPTDQTMYSQDDVVTVLGNTGNLSKGNDIFIGWGMSSSGNDIIYLNGDTFTITNNVNLYAIFVSPSYSYIEYTSSDKNAIVPSAKDFASDNPNTYIGSIYDKTLNVGKLLFSSTPIRIPANAFYNNRVLTSINIPNSVTDIGSSAFWQCLELQSITIPNSVITIGELAFFSCIGATSITIGNSVQSIGVNAFNTCNNVQSINIPNSVTSIGNYAFAACQGLTSATISTNLTSINTGVFSLCTSLVSITIPNSVTTIGNYAFSMCYHLTSITIPNSVTSIGEGAFNLCGDLTTVTFGSGVRSIGDYALSEDINIESFIYIGISDDWKSVSRGTGWHYNVNKTSTIYCQGDSQTISIDAI